MIATQNVLAIDDDSDVCELISATAEGMGIRCLATTDPTAFMNALSDNTTLILLDLYMPEMDGIEILRQLAKVGCKAGIVLISGSGKRIIETAEELIKTVGLSVVGQLRKPFRIPELEAVLKLDLSPTAPTPVLRDKVDIIEDADLHGAIARDEFVLHYQPQIDIATANISGVEALVRWKHPQRGLIFPDNFIGRLEDLGLIDQLGWLVFNRAMSEVAMFADEIGSVPMLSLNASVHSLNNLKFPDDLVALANKHGVPPDNITIEITESGLIKEISQTLDVLARLRMKSVRLSIDDFGTGYAMMQQLRSVPATEIKIDRSFVQNIFANDRDRIMVQKTIEIGRDLGMRVVGEGVETREQLGFLRENNCDSLQGYLFSRPIPATKLVDWLKAYQAKDFFSLTA